MKNRSKNILIIISAAFLPAAFFLISGPIKQDPSYHFFADNRPFLSLKNAVNIFTNTGFIIAGSPGVFQLLKPPNPGVIKSFRTPYFFFFSGVLLIGLGSSYYHYNPSNETLLWDRIPMTIAFMSLFCSVIAEHINKKTGFISGHSIKHILASISIYFIIIMIQKREFIKS